jgi:ribosomal protein L3
MEKGANKMKVTWKRTVVFLSALAVVITASIYSADHFLKATDGEENVVVTPETDDGTDAVIGEVELPTEEEEIVAIEQGVLEEEPEEAQSQEPEEVTEPEETAAEIEISAEEADKNVEVVYEIIDGEVKEVGTQIRMTAVLSGFGDTQPSYQWQYSDGSEWKDIEGATSSTYTLDVTRDNYNYSWRVSVTG